MLEGKSIFENDENNFPFDVCEECDGVSRWRMKISRFFIHEKKLLTFSFHFVIERVFRPLARFSFMFVSKQNFYFFSSHFPTSSTSFNLSDYMMFSINTFHMLLRSIRAGNKQASRETRGRENSSIKMWCRWNVLNFNLHLVIS